MASPVSVAYIEIRVFAHATEDEKKVLSAASNLLPIEQRRRTVFKKTALTGHYKNPIIMFEARIKEKAAIQTLIKRFAASLASIDKAVSHNGINRHVDKKNLYVRLDKQSAYSGELKLCSTDSLHFRIHFENSSSEKIVSFCRRYGMLS